LLPPPRMGHNLLYVPVCRVDFMPSPTEWVQSLGRCDGVDRLTGGRKAGREETAGPSQTRREAGIDQATAPQDPRGMAKAELLEAQS
jgi:hypothetical protein